MKAAHTPGPWEARINHWSRWEIFYAQGQLAGVAKWDDPATPPPVEEMHANASLIAAAPDLYDALLLLLTELGKGAAYTGAPSGCVEKARAAIAKATKGAA